MDVIKRYLKRNVPNEKIRSLINFLEDNYISYNFKLYRLNVPSFYTLSPTHLYECVKQNIDPYLNVHKFQDIALVIEPEPEESFLITMLDYEFLDSVLEI